MENDVFYKACLNGIYYKDSGIIDSWGIDDYDEMILVDLKENKLVMLYDSSLSGLIYEGACYPDNYGITWALTKEELEGKNND